MTQRLKYISKNNIKIYIIFFVVDLLKKILGVVLKVRYDVESIIQIKEAQTSNYEETNNIQEDDFELLLPIINEDNLQEFEQKLVCRSFKSNTVSYKLLFFICFNYIPIINFNYNNIKYNIFCYI